MLVARRAVLAMASLAVLVACGTASPVGSARFANAPPITRVDDRRDVARPPSQRKFQRWLYHFGTSYIRINRALGLTRDRRAIGVNALDEVPDSTWFTNRIGIRNLPVEEMRNGSAPRGSPEAHLPWTIISSKTGGTAVGFVVQDRRGVTYMLKFDLPHTVEVETAAAAVTGRILWACGFNVPEDHVVYFRRSDLTIGKAAQVTAESGDKSPLTDAYVDQQLAKVFVAPDGQIRGIASTFVPGTAVGGGPRLGVRHDDPNDRIPHELRRDYRGAAAIFAWLDHADIKEDNTLDAWQEDPVDASRHYLVHYLIDLGGALGAQSKSFGRDKPGKYRFHASAAALRLISLGLLPRPPRPPWSSITGIGLFDIAHYQPAKWKPNSAGQLSVLYADRFDKFWGAKILIRFTRAQLAAAVEAGRFSDPRAAPHLVDTLIARQRATAKHWFRLVSPIDEVTTATREDGTEVCFTDLALHHRLEPVLTHYKLSAFDAAGRASGWKAVLYAGLLGRSCIRGLDLAPGESRYTIVRIESSRRGVPPILIHIALAPGATHARVIGVYRL